MWLSTPEIAYAVSATGKSGFAARALARLDTLRRADTPGGRATAGTEPTAEMIDRARSGDPDAFAAVFEAYGVDVLRVCRRILGDPESASDARSDVFLKVRRSLASYDSARPFRSWLLSVTSHHCIDRLRHRATERRIFADTELEAGELEGSSPSPLSRVLARESHEALDRALETLPLEYRLPLLMRYYADASYDDIAESLGTTRARVGSLIFRAKKKLRAQMTGNADVPAFDSQGGGGA